MRAGGGHVTGAQMFTRFTSVPVFLAARLGNVMALYIHTGHVLEFCTSSRRALNEAL